MDVKLKRWQVILSILAILVPAGWTAFHFIDAYYAKAVQLAAAVKKSNDRYEEFLRAQQNDINNQMQQWQDRTGKKEAPLFIENQQKALDYRRCLYERDTLKVPGRSCTK